MNSVNLIGSKSFDSDDHQINKKIMLNKQYLLANGGNDQTTVDDNNQTSQELVSSTNDELHWCPDLDYQLSCDNTFKRPSKTADIDGSQISFTMANDGGSRNNQNFDIHLAQIDIETFKSEDIRRIRFDQSMNVSNDDTLRIVDSISSFSQHLLPPKQDGGEEALSIDSLDLSVDNEINSELIQKCSENDRTKYKIAMIESQLNQSQMINKNPFNVSGYRSNDMQQSQQNELQSPGNLVKMFIQNRTNSVENSFDAKNNQANGSRNESNSFTTEEAIDESTGNSLNTIDSNELPLHVLDLSKKLRSLNLNKQQQQAKYGFSTSASSNTSFTSTTTSSSATNDKRNKPHHHHNPMLSTNPFLNICKENVMTKCAGTQFPDVLQDKEVQASFEDSTPIKEAPVLVYYPNYSLPDLSFLQEIFGQDSGGGVEQHPAVYLSPVKHEPVKVKPECSVRLRTTNNNTNHDDHHVVNGQKKCRPKSYTDYEAILNQDLSHIKDWDSLNLLLPDDFKEFIEQNNLLKSRNTRNAENNNNDDDQEQTSRNAGFPFLPAKTMLPPNHKHRLFQNVKLRPHSVRNLNYHQDSPSKRFSLQEHNLDQNYMKNHPHHYNQYPNPGYQEFMNEPAINSFMIRSQTMPNCQMAFNHHAGGNCYPPPAPPPPPRYHNCCCHSGCHSPSLHGSQSSPQKNSNNFNWDSISSSNSFKKLLSFLSKLDEYSSSHSDSTNTEIPEPKEQNPMRKNAKNSPANVNNNNTETFDNVGRARKTSRHRTSTTSRNNSGCKNFEQKNPTCKSKTVNIQTTATATTATTPVLGPTKNSSDNKTKIILKRPTSLNKSNSSSSSKHHHNNDRQNHGNSANTGIPLPKRLSSGIPVLKQQPNTQSSASQNHNNSGHYHQQQQFGRGSNHHHHHQQQHYRNDSNRF